MKAVFREFYNNEMIDFKNLTDDVIIIFDTNTLLNIYRYSKSTRDTFLESLKRVNNNIWIPYQVGLEFNLNRRKVMLEMQTTGESISHKIENAAKKFINEVKKEIDEYPIKSIDGSVIRKEINKTFKERVETLQSEFLNDEFSKIEKLIDKEDDKMIFIAEIFEGKVGESFNQTDIEKICEEGVKRYEKNVPPGYKDKNKTDMRIYNDLEFESKYGDLIVWKQIIKKAKDDKKSIIVFVTDDYKEDWWYEIRGQKIGARAELKNELRREAQADLILMNTNTFLRETSQEKVDADLVETENITESPFIEVVDTNLTNMEKNFELHNLLSYENYLKDNYKNSIFDKKPDINSIIEKINSIKSEIETFYNNRIGSFYDLNQYEDFKETIEALIVNINTLQINVYDVYFSVNKDEIHTNLLLKYEKECQRIQLKFMHFKKKFENI